MLVQLGGRNELAGGFRSMFWARSRPWLITPFSHWCQSWRAISNRSRHYFGRLPVAPHVTRNTEELKILKPAIQLVPVDMMCVWSSSVPSQPNSALFAVSHCALPDGGFQSTVEFRRIWQETSSAAPGGIVWASHGMSKICHAHFCYGVWSMLPAAGRLVGSAKSRTPCLRSLL